MKLFLASLALLVSLSLPASAQFAESLTSAPGGSGPISYNGPKQVSGAVGAPIGSPTFVMPAQRASSIISLSPAFADWLQPYIDEIVNLAIAAIVAWGLAWARTHLGINLDEKQRSALTTALQNQAGSLIADGKVKLTSGKIDVHSDALANAANELMRSVPDAAKHFGITPDFVAARILDTIPQIAAGAQMIAAHHAENAGLNLP